MIKFIDKLDGLDSLGSISESAQASIRKHSGAIAKVMRKAQRLNGLGDAKDVITADEAIKILNKENGLMNDDEMELFEMEAEALEMELQLTLSAEGGESVDGTATDKISVAFNKAIMQYKKGFFKSERTQIFVCKAPQFWSKKGLAIEDVYITVGVIKKAIEKHDLKIEHFINFPDMLREKTNLFISKTTQNAFVQLTELKDLKNHKIVVAVHLKKDKNGNVIIYDIRSVHGRVQRQIDKWIKQGLTIKNKSN